MRTIARLGAIAGAALAATAFALPSAASATPAHSPAGVVFVQTDDPAGNSIVVYDRSTSGRLTKAGTYPTGGKGGVLDGSVVDHLASQGSVDLDGGNLYVVNAGSNTITTFAVFGDHLVRGQIIWSGGTFPVSITTHGLQLYVLDARNGGAIQGYLRTGAGLLRIPSWRRTLGLDPTAGPEFTHTPGQVAFTPDGSKLVVTTKGNTSSIDVFGVQPTGPSTPVVTSLPDAVPFAVTFDPAGHLAVAEAGTNSVATFAVHANGTLAALDSAATGQAATCWIVADGRNLYASNAGGGNLSDYRINGGGALTATGVTTVDAGTVDATVTPDGRYLYVQAGAAGLVHGFRIGAGGALTSIGSVTVPDAIGAEGIASK